MPKEDPTTVAVHITYVSETKEMTVNTNATPPEMMQITTAIQAQLTQVFVDLDAKLRENAKVSESKILRVPPGMRVQ